MDYETALRRYGELLCTRGLSEQNWRRVLRLREQTGQRISVLLSRLDLLAEELIAATWGELLDIPVLEAEELSTATPMETTVSANFARKATRVYCQSNVTRSAATLSWR